MASTTFFPGTVITSPWLNGINNAVYNVLPTLAPLISPAFTSPSLGVATASSINKVIITQPVTSATISVANLKTFTVNNTITIGGTDNAVLTLGAGTSTFSGTSSGTNTGDQNLFSTVRVAGQADVVADAPAGVLTLAAGSGVSLTTDSTTDTVTISTTSTSAMVLLGSATITTPVSNIDFLNIFTSAYDRYLITAYNINPTATQVLYLQLATGGTVISAGNYLGAYVGSSSNSSGTAWSLSQTTVNGQANIDMVIQNVNQSAGRKSYIANAVFQASTGETIVSTVGGHCTNVGTVSGFRMYFSNTTFAVGGYVRVYGIKNT